jgi:uncharacterized protein
MSDLDLSDVIKKVAERCLLQVRALPGAGISEVRGLANGELKVAVKAPPEKGKANEEIITVLARFFDTNKSRIGIVRGLANRSKQVIIKELDLELATDKMRNLGWKQDSASITKTTRPKHRR